MKVLITGATGFVGKTLVPYIYGKGCTEMALLVRNEEKARKMFRFCSNIKLINLCESTWREQIISYSPEVVLHMAAFFSTRCDNNNATEIVHSNILFSTLLLEALSHTKFKYFINVGTFTEYLYGNGEFFANNLYSASKTAMRPIIKYYQTQSQFKWINVIVYSPYGRHNEKKKVIDYLIDAIDSPVQVDFSKGEQVLDFIHVDDMADFFYTLFIKVNCIKGSFVELHLGSGVGHSIREVASIIEQVWGKKINANWGGLPYRQYDTMHAVAPISKNIELLGWKAKIGITEGIRILKEDHKLLERQ